MRPREEPLSRGFLFLFLPSMGGSEEKEPQSPGFCFFMSI